MNSNNEQRRDDSMTLPRTNFLRPVIRSIAQDRFRCSTMLAGISPCTPSIMPATRVHDGGFLLPARRGSDTCRPDSILSGAKPEKLRLSVCQSVGSGSLPSAIVMSHYCAGDNVAFIIAPNNCPLSHTHTHTYTHPHTHTHTTSSPQSSCQHTSRPPSRPPSVTCEPRSESREQGVCLLSCSSPLSLQCQEAGHLTQIHHHATTVAVAPR